MAHMSVLIRARRVSCSPYLSQANGISVLKNPIEATRQPAAPALISIKGESRREPRGLSLVLLLRVLFYMERV